MFPGKCAIFMAVYGIVFTVAQGEVKNGYEPEIELVRESLKALTILVSQDKDLSMFQKSAMKSKISKLGQYIAYYELTRDLLGQFQLIAPELYNEVNNITDHTGQAVTIFVRFVPEEKIQAGAAGTTNLDCSGSDKNIYQSEYGPRSVSIRIASRTKSLEVLAHEFGHAKYQIANLATYYEYYSEHYLKSDFKSTYIGHKSNDASGQKALEFEKLFRETYLNFSKNSSVKIKSVYRSPYSKFRPGNRKAGA